MMGDEDFHDLTGEARSTYEAFDCAKAVALIAFIGLLSNFQDTIDNFTTLLNSGRRRRRREETAEGWKDAVYSAIEAFRHASQPLQPNKKGRWAGHVLQAEDLQHTNTTITRDTLQDGSSESEWLWGHEQPDPEHKRNLLQDLAHTAPMMAMWLVDTGDGRVSGKKGRARVCEASRSLTNTHGWLGFIAAHLLTSTLAVAFSEYQESKELLDRAGLSAGTVDC